MYLKHGTYFFIFTEAHSCIEVQSKLYLSFWTMLVLFMKMFWMNLHYEIYMSTLGAGMEGYLLGRYGWVLSGQGMDLMMAKVDCQLN
jgi:hypothetical protein